VASLSEANQAGATGHAAEHKKVFGQSAEGRFVLVYERDDDARRRIVTFKEGYSAGGQLFQLHRFDK